MNKPDGGPAFPRPFSSEQTERFHEDHDAQRGLSRRDYFAAHAIAGLIVAMTPFGAKAAHDDATRAGQTANAYIASEAYDIADAMLAESGQ